jgi:hypothetical protein
MCVKLCNAAGHLQRMNRLELEATRPFELLKGQVGRRIYFLQEYVVVLQCVQCCMHKHC